MQISVWKSEPCLSAGEMMDRSARAGDGRTSLSRAEGFKRHRFLMGCELDKRLFFSAFYGNAGTALGECVEDGAVSFGK